MVEVRDCSGLEMGAFKDLPTLLAEYGEESAIAGLPPPKIDEVSYLRMERAGISNLVVATLDGELIGFILVIVNLNPHYSAKLAVVESFFVAKAHRKSGAGRMLQKRAEEIAKQKGAVGLLMSAPVGSRLARVLELDKGYRETNRVFFRSLT